MTSSILPELLHLGAWSALLLPARYFHGNQTFMMITGMTTSSMRAKAIRMTNRSVSPIGPPWGLTKHIRRSRQEAVSGEQQTIGDSDFPVDTDSLASASLSVLRRGVCSLADSTVTVVTGVVVGGGCVRKIIKVTDYGHHIPDISLLMTGAEGWHTGHADAVFDGVPELAVRRVPKLLLPEFWRLRRHTLSPLFA